MSDRQVLNEVLSVVYGKLKLVAFEYTVGNCIRIVFDEVPVSNLKYSNGLIDIIFEDESWYINTQEGRLSSANDKNLVKSAVNSLISNAEGLAKIEIKQDGSLLVFTGENIPTFISPMVDTPRSDVLWYLKIAKQLDIYGLANGQISMS